jgi:hypothetical protein
VHGGAVTFLLSAGSTWPLDCDELLELELELLELLLELLDVHGGTTRFVMLLFSAITSWFWAAWPCSELCGVLPPGVRRMVLIGCVLSLELELLELELELELLELELLELDCGHGGTATVWVNVSLGITMRVDPGGACADCSASPTPPVGSPDCSCPGCGHGGTLIVMSLRCLARMIVRTPGVSRAVATASLELDEELLLLPPHAASATVAAMAASPRPTRATVLLLPAIQSPLQLACDRHRGLYPDPCRSETDGR